MSLPSASSSADSAPTMHFDTDGQWNVTEVQGPAIHAPSWVKNIILDKIRIEFLDISEPNIGFYAKNHIVSAVTFVEPVQFNRRQYVSAHISMELGLWKKVKGINVVSNLMIRPPGEHYHPGVFIVALHNYSTPTHCSVQYHTYALSQGTTVGMLLNAAIKLNMHHFLFLPYTSEGRWKGCGNFMLHFWVVLVCTKVITSNQSKENLNSDLSSDLTLTYLPDGSSTFEHIGRGWWLSWNPIQDNLTPEVVYNKACLMHQSQWCKSLGHQYFCANLYPRKMS
ncbi:hypothetical protein EDC04DRAFT_2569322 [Pisolithus marmoratus]|nr:hypothetical protein EDC04DRAFT_2569322 [Pisolithus marmoratus]